MPHLPEAALNAQWVAGWGQLCGSARGRLQAVPSRAPPSRGTWRPWPWTLASLTGEHWVSLARCAIPGDAGRGALLCAVAAARRLQVAGVSARPTGCFPTLPSEFSEVSDLSRLQLCPSPCLLPAWAGLRSLALVPRGEPLPWTRSSWSCSDGVLVVRTGLPGSCRRHHLEVRWLRASHQVSDPL